MFAAIAITAVVAFVAGIVFHKVVVSEAESVKVHITKEVTLLHNELKAVIERTAQRI